MLGQPTSPSGSPLGSQRRVPVAEVPHVLFLSAYGQPEHFGRFGKVGASFATLAQTLQSSAWDEACLKRHVQWVISVLRGVSSASRHGSPSPVPGVWLRGGVGSWEAQGRESCALWGRGGRSMVSGAPQLAQSSQHGQQAGGLKAPVAGGGSRLGCGKGRGGSCSGVWQPQVLKAEVEAEGSVGQATGARSSEVPSLLHRGLWPRGGRWKRIAEVVCGSGSRRS